MRILLLFVMAAAFAGAAAAQASAPASELNASEQALVRGSREAILKTGITEGYFDEHFRLARVVDSPGDRRVVWRLTVNGYEATVADAVGFYTEGGRRVDTHSVASTLNSAQDITHTITRARAESVMRRCIGRFTDPRIEYRAHGPAAAAALLLTAQSVAVPRAGRGRALRARRRREEREARERREKARRAQAGAVAGRDAVEEDEDGDDRPVILLGAVDLVTGECTSGRALAGPERPPARR